MEKLIAIVAIAMVAGWVFDKIWDAIENIGAKKVEGEIEEMRQIKLTAHERMMEDFDRDCE